MKSTWLSVRGLLGLGCLGLAGSLAQACLYDSSQRCGEDRVLSEAGNSCVCPEEAVEVEGVCVVCADDEVATSNGCECPEGMAKNADDICEEASLGADCSSSDECAAPFDFCQPDGGYCTSTGCESDDECEGEYACTPSSGGGMGGAGNGGDSFCQRPPQGLGMSCETHEDCAEYEATHCDPYNLVCLVENCSLEADDCFSGYECCDLSAFGVEPTVCVEEGMCF